MRRNTSERQLRRNKKSDFVRGPKSARTFAVRRVRPESVFFRIASTENARFVRFAVYSIPTVSRCVVLSLLFRKRIRRRAAIRKGRSPIAVTRSIRTIPSAFGTNGKRKRNQKAFFSKFFFFFAFFPVFSPDTPRYCA